MARRLDPEEERKLELVLSEAAAQQERELWLEGLEEKRDRVLWMSPELRAFFDKNPRQLFTTA